MNESEKNVVSKMIGIYCQSKHKPEGEICESCLSLESYAHARLEKCKFGDEKPQCKDCPIHCYKPENRAQIQAVMRFSGPRMMFYHPVLALKHLFAGFISKKKV